MKPDGLIEVLLVEDDPRDVDLIRESLEHSKIAIRLAVARTGGEALDRLHRRGEHAGAPLPDFVLLDLRLPDMPGNEILADIRQDPDLEGLPVVVLTVSDAEEDIERAHDHRANCYVKKPMGLEEFRQVVRTIGGFWLTVANLPYDPYAKDS